METFTPEAVGLSSSRLGRLDGLMQSYIDAGKAPGIVLSIARRGKVVLSGAWGIDDIAAKTPMREDAVFRLASQTKTFTMTAALMLYEEGRFLYSDPIEKYLPEFTGMKVCTGSQDGKLVLVDATSPITIEDLCMHHAGVLPMEGAYPLDEALQQYYSQAGKEDASERLQERVARLASLPLCCQPGSAFYYGDSHNIVARLVEVLSGKPFADFLEKRIFTPLGMADTGFWLPPEKAGRLARGYFVNASGNPEDMGEGERTYWLSRPRLADGSTGLLSTAADYQRFGQMLANGGQLGGVRLLSRKTIEFMALNRLRSDQLPLRPFADLVLKGLGFGLGVWTVINPAEMGIPCSLGSFGWWGYFGTMPWIDPTEQLSGVMMTQVGPCLAFAPYLPPLEVRRVVYQAILD